MNTSTGDTERSADLRERAESMVQNKVPNLENLSLPEIREIIHELQVSAAELKLQNEALCIVCEEEKKTPGRSP